MKTKVIPFLVLITTYLTACSPVTSSSSSSEPDTPQITYEDIYHYELGKSDIKSGATTYFGSDGYVQNESQGYNHFYYRALKNNEKVDMTYEDDGFVLDDAYLKNEYMKSSTTVTAIREFVSPITGDARIGVPAFLKEGTSPNIVIYLNDEILGQTIVSEEGIHIEKRVSLKQGDVISFALIGDALIKCNPEIDFTALSEPTLHTTTNGHYGDVHPYYNVEEKKMYMYYLSTGNQNSGPRRDRFQSMLTVSSDTINYNHEEIYMDETSRPEQDLYFVLNVFKDADGKYRTYQGMGNHASSAVSDDLITWRNGLEPYVDEKDDLFKYAHAAYNDADVISCRDPDAIYDPESQSYYCVILSYMTPAAASGEKWINLYVGDAKGRYSTVATKMVNMTGRGDSECPQIMKIGNRWYLFYSVFGSGTKGNVGRLCYRFGEEGVLPQNVDWNNKPEYYINAQDLHAAQVVEVGDKYYVYGWLSEKYNASYWGGYINTPIEVYQKEDGVLQSKMDEKFLELANKGLLYKQEDIKSSVSSFGLFNRSLVDMTLHMTSGESYLSISEGSRQFLVGVETHLDTAKLVIKNVEDGYKVDVEIDKKDIYDLDIVIDSSFIEVNCNDEQVVSAITNLSPSYDDIGLSLGENCSVSSLKINKLANSNNFYL